MPAPPRYPIPSTARTPSPLSEGKPTASRCAIVRATARGGTSGLKPCPSPSAPVTGWLLPTNSYIPTFENPWSIKHECESREGGDGTGLEYRLHPLNDGSRSCVGGHIAPPGFHSGADFLFASTARLHGAGRQDQRQGQQKRRTRACSQASAGIPVHSCPSSTAARRGPEPAPGPPSSRSWLCR